MPNDITPTDSERDAARNILHLQRTKRCNNEDDLALLIAQSRAKERVVLGNLLALLTKAQQNYHPKDVCPCHTCQSVRELTDMLK